MHSKGDSTIWSLAFFYSLVSHNLHWHPVPGGAEITGKIPGIIGGGGLGLAGAIPGADNKLVLAWRQFDVGAPEHPAPW